MTDTSVYQSLGRKESAAFSPNNGPIVEESYWGFSVLGTTRGLVSHYISQGVALFFGAAFLAAMIGLWILPGAAVQSDSLTMRLGLTAFFGIISWILINFANRGVVSEIQIDCNLCEVREVLKNRVGKSTLVGQFSFDSFDGITIDRSSGDKEDVALSLNSVDPAKHIHIARGSEAQIGVLYGRLTRDLMLEQPSRTFAAVTPQPLG